MIVLNPYNRSSFAATILISCAGLAAACDAVGPTDAGWAVLAKGSGQPAVQGVNPEIGVQGTTLDVQVVGTGFQAGDVVTFLLDGVPAAQVTTNSTTFVNENTMVASVTITVDAALELYDVEVSSSGGRKRKGVGIDLFAVHDTEGNGPVPGVERGTSQAEVTFSDGTTSSGSPVQIESDGRNVAGWGTTYADDVCGVQSLLRDDLSNDLTVLPAFAKIKRPDAVTCGNSTAPRGFTISLSLPADGGSPPAVTPEDTFGTFLTVDGLGLLTGTTTARATFHNAVCDQIIFGGTSALTNDPNAIRGEPVTVIHDASTDSWTVHSDARRGYCRLLDRDFHFTFELVVVRGAPQ